MLNSLDTIDPTTKKSKDWRDYVKSIGWLEQTTGYKFLSNLPQSVQDSIKNNTNLGILAKIPPDKPKPASLIAAYEPIETSAIVPGTNLYSSVRQYSFPEESPIRIFIGNLEINSISEVGLDQQSHIQVGLEQISTPQRSPSQVSTLQTSSSQISNSQLGISQIGTSQNSLTQIGTNQFSKQQVSTTEVSTTEIGTTKIDTIEASSSQIDLSQVSTFEIGSITQFNSSKISLPSGIPSQQLLSIHSLTPESINTIANLQLT
jgi:hypothetical protein